MAVPMGRWGSAVQPDRPFVVVGAGASGLAVAAELSRTVRVMLVERLPSTGGVLGYEHPVVAALTEACERAGVVFVLGTTAVRRDHTRLLIAGPGGVGWIEYHHLVYAGGSRPATQAELGIGGERLAGVFPAPVAIHLMEAHVRLGNSVVVLGAGDWCARAAHELQQQGAARVTLTSVQFPGWAPTQVCGDSRVAELTLANGDLRRTIDCDAVILAGQPRPLRNVDGAIRPSAGITYVQPAAETQSVQTVVAYGRECATRLADQLVGLPS